MKLSEFQDRIDPNRKIAMQLLVAYIKDGLREIQLTTDENVERATTNLVANQREYDIPSTCIRMRSVRVLDTDGVKYYPIPRLIGDAADEVT
tara:strand:- start:7289 stop:7564 length:276 start_codon:yes stop_codon:yes gene_type:complete